MSSPSGRVTGTGATPSAPDSTTDVCNWSFVTVGTGTTGRLYIGSSSISYDKALADSVALGATVTEIDGPGERSSYSSRPETAMVGIEIAGTAHVIAADYGDPAESGFDRPDDSVVEPILVDIAERYVGED
jgi:hypothetical protein